MSRNVPAGEGAMTRYIAIRACGACPYAVPGKVTVAECRIKQRPVPNFAAIPDWWPLPVLKKDGNDGAKQQD